jgi:hypothetical protein
MVNSRRRCLAAGNCRHAHPVRTTYKIASTTARRGYSSGRPPGLTGGSSGSITAHCSSVVSDGYCARRLTPSLLITTPARSLVRMQRAGVTPIDYATAIVEILADNADPLAGEVYAALDMPFVVLVGQTPRA